MYCHWRSSYQERRVGISGIYRRRYEITVASIRLHNLKIHYYSYNWEYLRWYFRLFMFPIYMYSRVRFGKHRHLLFFMSLLKCIHKIIYFWLQSETNFRPCVFYKESALMEGWCSLGNYWTKITSKVEVIKF